jgi:hypothetical protein
MTLQEPYKRTVRPFKVGDYLPSDGSYCYVRTPSYSLNPGSYIRGFLVLQRDIRSLFEIIHPSDTNLDTYSEHIGMLMVRACFEIETNLKAILRENGYTSRQNWTMDDYKKVEQSHNLSRYEVLLPEWVGAQSTLKPFEKWASAKKLEWYTAYNTFKHDRVENLSKATFRNLIHAWCGLFVIIGAQYGFDDFSVEKQNVGFENFFKAGEFRHGIGGYLSIKFPTNWPEAEKYEFSLTAKNFDDPNFAVKFPY